MEHLAPAQAHQSEHLFLLLLAFEMKSKRKKPGLHQVADSPHHLGLLVAVVAAQTEKEKAVVAACQQASAREPVPAVCIRVMCHFLLYTYMLSKTSGQHSICFHTRWASCHANIHGFPGTHTHTHTHTWGSTPLPAPTPGVTPSAAPGCCAETIPFCICCC
jgi:hypothetical protein